jgi:hypothetical protein
MLQRGGEEAEPGKGLEEKSMRAQPVSYFSGGGPWWNALQDSRPAPLPTADPPEIC